MEKQENAFISVATCLFLKDPPGHQFGEWKREQDLVREWLGCGGI